MSLGTQAHPLATQPYAVEKGIHWDLHNQYYRDHVLPSKAEGCGLYLSICVDQKGRELIKYGYTNGELKHRPSNDMRNMMQMLAS